MKILIISQYYAPESFRINDLVERLIEKKHQVVVLTGLPNYPTGKIFPKFSFFKGPWSEEINGAHVLRVPIFPRGKAGKIRLVLNYLSFVLSACLLGLPRLRTFGAFDATFVWASSPLTAAIPGIIYGKLKRQAPHIWIQDLWPESIAAVGAMTSSFSIKLVGQLVKWIYQNSAHLFVQSQEFCASLKVWGARDEQIIYLPNWADRIFEHYPLQTKIDITSHKPPIQLSSINSSLDANSFRILFAGNLGHAQDLDSLLEAVRLLPSNKKIEFHFIGNGSCKKSFQEKVLKSNLGNIIQFSPAQPLENMPALYQEFDALLVSLIRDPHIQKVLPSKVQSYLISSKPILAMADGETMRVITQSGAGLCSPAGDAKKFIENAIALASTSEIERRRMGVRGQSYYWKHFSAETQVSRLVEILNKKSEIQTDEMRKVI